jgi:hypothetical protein
VVAADDDHLGAGAGESRERVVAERHGVDAGQRAVVDVTGHGDHVDALRAHHLDEVVDIARLRVQQVDPVEGATKVPVGGVQHSHTSNVGSRADKSRSPRSVVWTTVTRNRPQRVLPRSTPRLRSRYDRAGEDRRVER